MGLYPSSRNVDNFSHVTKPQERSELKQEIENFLKSAAAQSNQRHLCSRCGADMKFINTTFSLLGTGSAWNIKVPMCGCAVENAAEGASAGRQQADDVRFDPGAKKPSAA